MERTYVEQVLADIVDFLSNEYHNYDMADFSDADDFGEKLNDDLWTEDSITGNASGSYTFNSNEAKENVLADMDTVKEALTEFCVDAQRIADAFLNSEWEYLDVTARCYVLGQAIGEYINENREVIEEAIEEARA